MLSGTDINTLFQPTVNNVPGLMKSTSLFQKPGNVSTTLNIQIYIQVNTSWELELYEAFNFYHATYLSENVVTNKICIKYHETLICYQLYYSHSITLFSKATHADIYNIVLIITYSITNCDIRLPKICHE